MGRAYHSTREQCQGPEARAGEIKQNSGHHVWIPGDKEPVKTHLSKVCIRKIFK